jgi:hypothetical protein
MVRRDSYNQNKNLVTTPILKVVHKTHWKIGLFVMILGLNNYKHDKWAIIF